MGKQIENIKGESNFELPFDVIEALNELEIPIANLLRKLRPQIEKGEYNLIIGDDASGRIPTLILGEVIKRRYEQNELSAPMVRFIAGSTGLYDTATKEHKVDLVKEYLSKVKDKMGDSAAKKVLLITDTISEGKSMRVIMQALKENNLRADIVAIGFLGSEQKKQALEQEFNSDIYSDMTMTPKIYFLYEFKKEIHGVEKDPGKLFSRRYKDRFFLTDEKKQAQQFVNQTRKVAYAISDRLFKKYKRSINRNKAGQ